MLSLSASFRAFRLCLAAAAASLLLAACGGDGNSSSGPQWTVGGTLTGLTGTLVLKNNGGNDLSLTANGGFVFSATVAQGRNYNVTIGTQPADQTCVVTNGSGSMGAANVLAVQVQCTVNGGATTHTISGNISGLVGSVVLKNNLADALNINADGSFTFASAVNVGGNYNVSVATQPTGQTCTVNSGSGSIGGSDITNVSITCASNMYTVSGRISGLVGGVAEPLGLQLNGGNDLSRTGDGTFEFTSAPLSHGSSYSVTVTGKPTPQTCTVINGSGTITAHITNVYVLCATSTFTVGGTITGLDGTLVLSNNISNSLTRNVNGAFSFSGKVPYANTYTVAITTQPAGQTCTLTNETGTAIANISNVQVNCVDHVYNVHVEVAGLSGSVDPLTVQNNGGDTLVFTDDDTDTFATPIAHGDAWNVVLTPPSDRVCTLYGGSGTIGASAVTVYVVCLDTVPQPPAVGLGLIERPRELNLSWLSSAGAQWYHLFQSLDNGNTWAQLGGDIADDQDGNSVTEMLPLHRQDWLNLRYRLEACNIYGCTMQTALSVTATARVPDLIGYFKSANADAGDHLGSSVALSNDGNTLVIGAPCEASNNSSTPSNNSASCAGAVYVFLRDGNGDWTQSAYLKSSAPDKDDFFGNALALSADGNTLAVGATGESSNATGINGDSSDNSLVRAGAVYVFARSGNTWSQQAYVKASNTDGGDQFGASVALSADGNTLAVGATGEDSNAIGINGSEGNDIATAESSGAVYVFARSGNTWSQQAYVKASNTFLRDSFGTSIALSSSGDSLAAGAPGEDSPGTGINPLNQGDDAATAGSGAVYLYARSGNVWSQQAYVKASNTGKNDKFGSAVAFSASGAQLAIGAPGEDSEATGVNDPDQGNSTSSGDAFNAGAVYLLSWDGSNWSQLAYVKASNSGYNDLFGSTLAFSADGNTLAVGAHGESGSGTGLTAPDTTEGAINAGAVYVYGFDGSDWSFNKYVKASNTAADDYFSASIALSADGDLMAVGADGEDSAGRGLTLSNGTVRSDNSATDSGVVYLY